MTPTRFSAEINRAIETQIKLHQLVWFVFLTGAVVISAIPGLVEFGAVDSRPVVLWGLACASVIEGLVAIALKRYASSDKAILNTMRSQALSTQVQTRDNQSSVSDTERSLVKVAAFSPVWLITLALSYSIVANGVIVAFVQGAPTIAYPFYAAGIILICLNYPLAAGRIRRATELLDNAAMRHTGIEHS